MEFAITLIARPAKAVIRAHYAGAAGVLMARHFAGFPVLSVSYPMGLGHDAHYHKDVDAAPASIETVNVRTATGEHRYLPLSLHAISWLLAMHDAVEFESWTPIARDPERAAFGRILLNPHGTADHECVVAAAHAILDALARHKLQAIPILDGVVGLALWIPFDDGPTYAALALWLHAFARTVVDGHPGLLTIEPLKADRGNRIHLGLRSNHPGMGGTLPYSLLGTPSLEVAMPCPIEQLGVRANGDVTAATFEAHVEEHGDEFEQLRAAIPEQPFAALWPTIIASHRKMFAVPLETQPREVRGVIVNAALAILADGRARDADTILAEALERGLLPKSTTRKYVYAALHGYELRTAGAGRVPKIVQIPNTARFRINRPADDWPDIELPPTRRWIGDADLRAAIARVRKSSTGGIPEAFERAACEAFALLGFKAQHIGGNGQPDGILTAPLGSEGYRAVLECKTAMPGSIVNNPRPEEAATFRASAGAQHSILLGPAFCHTLSFDAELEEHAVSVWTVDDLVTALEEQIAPRELRAAFEPGHADRAIQAMLLERDHGRRKHVEVIAGLIERLGWQTQNAFAPDIPFAETPALTEETLFELIDEALVHDGVTSGATRAEVEEALDVCRVRGVLHKTGNGYIVETPPVKARSDAQ